MNNKFFSLDVSWKRTLIASFVTSLAVFIIGFGTWYVVAYLPIERHLVEATQRNDRLQKIYDEYLAKQALLSTSTKSQ